MTRLVLLAALLLAGCSHPVVDAPSTPPPAQPTVAPSAARQEGLSAPDEQLYMALLIGNGFPYARENKADSIGLGHDICQALDRGATPQDIKGSSHSPELIRVAGNAAVVFLCPQHDGKTFD